ncbi:MAG TPA: glycosyltransferase family 2 protein [Anaerolineales bacterium]|nr:glycosyltransferase family 2 protein [Anaerolineales bacterium]
MEWTPTVSVIIPTYNRKDSLLRTLDSLKRQSFPAERMEVIVVDDGSSDDTPTISSQKFPFTFRYLRQKNQGATAARNYGAQTSQSEILIFIDDDVIPSAQTLEALAEVYRQETQVLATGTLIRCSGGQPSVYASIMLALESHIRTTKGDVELHHLNCNTELLACKRSDFFDLGMLQDPTDGHGWPNWDDVDFGYRAHLKGFRLLQIGKASGEHWDYSISDRTVACKRWYRASKSAVWLFKKHHPLQTLIPMLNDKTPLAWGQDSLFLIARKLARSVVSSQLIVGWMEKFVGVLERHYPSPALLLHFYYWLQGAYMYQGYREGLREFELEGFRPS